MKLANKKHQYIWSAGKKSLKRKKKGIILAFVNPDNKVIIGFSLCHKNDKYDYIGGKKDEGFGLMLAYKRAQMWKDLELAVPYASKLPQDHPKDRVFVPQTIDKKLKGFIERCRRYYKDKELPEWTKVYGAI